MDLPQRVREWIQENRLVRPGDHVIVGLSGGGDSVCLLLCLYELREELGFSLSAVHIHHGIRGEEADEDAAFAENLCRERNLPFRLVREDVPAAAGKEGRSLEEAGRMVRRRIFREERERWERLLPGCRARTAVAQHRDDQAETVLMNLCRGTGLTGLGGMPPEQDGLIRPLLFLRRGEIEAWLRERGQAWRTDSTNADPACTRNRVRSKVLPLLTEQVNRRSTENIAALADRAREIEAYLEQEAEAWLRAQAQSRPDGLALPAAALAALPAALCEPILVLAARKTAGGCLRNLSSRHVGALRALLSAQVGKQVCLPGGITVQREYEDLLFCGEAEEKAHRKSFAADPPQAEFAEFPYEKGQKFPQNRYTKWFDCDKIKNAVRFRHRRSGDRIELAGVGSRKVKSYMIDAKIPAAARDSVWLLTDGEDVMWIVGYRMSAAYQVSPQTKRILEVRIRGQEEPDAREGRGKDAVPCPGGDHERQNSYPDFGDGSEPENRRGGGTDQPGL